MPPGFTSCGSGGSTIGLYVLRIIDVSLKFADVDAPLSVDPGGFGAGSTPDVVRSWAISASTWAAIAAMLRFLPPNNNIDHLLVPPRFCLHFIHFACSIVWHVASLASSSTPHRLEAELEVDHASRYKGESLSDCSETLAWAFPLWLIDSDRVFWPVLCVFTLMALRIQLHQMTVEVLFPDPCVWNPWVLSFAAALGSYITIPDLLRGKPSREDATRVETLKSGPSDDIPASIPIGFLPMVGSSPSFFDGLFPGSRHVRNPFRTSVGSRAPCGSLGFSDTFGCFWVFSFWNLSLEGPFLLIGSCFWASEAILKISATFLRQQERTPRREKGLHEELMMW